MTRADDIQKEIAKYEALDGSTNLFTYNIVYIQFKIDLLLG